MKLDVWFLWGRCHGYGHTQGGVVFATQLRTDPKIQIGSWSQPTSRDIVPRCSSEKLSDEFRATIHHFHLHNFVNNRHPAELIRSRDIHLTDHSSSAHFERNVAAFGWIWILNFLDTWHPRDIRWTSSGSHRQRFDWNINGRLLSRSDVSRRFVKDHQQFVQFFCLKK